jgi:hypothetical protein
LATLIFLQRPFRVLLEHFKHKISWKQISVLHINWIFF